MANKKLKVEVELETAKAKRQAKELEQATGSGGGFGGSSAPGAKASPAADRMADALDKAFRPQELLKAMRDSPKIPQNELIGLK